MATSSSFGDANAGFQAGYIAGSVNNPTFHHHAAPEPLETAPKPTIIIPFPRDRDFVRRDTICDQVINAGAEPGSWVALVGLGGVGKSQIAIEYAYQIRDKSPEAWVFWVHASNAARYEQSFREVADQIRLPGRQNTQDNIFQLVGSWLRSDKSGKWVLILDNVDDATFLLQVQSGRQDAQGSSSGSENNRPLWTYLPHCQKGTVLITTRRRDVALSLVESRCIVDIGPMSLEDARKLVEKKLGTLSDDEDMKTAGALAQALEYIPLAIVQATSYIAQRGLRYSMQKYLKKLKRSDREKTSLLDIEGGHLRRDWEAKNSIILTWQISFDHIRQSRPSAADLLSFMSWCDRQGIPETLLQEMVRTTSASQNHENQRDDQYNTKDSDDHYNSENHDDDGSADNSASDDSQSATSASDSLEEDILMLRDFSFIHIIGDGTLFEMHRLVQLSMRKWLEAEGQQERWKQTFIKCLSLQIPNGEYENWTKCQMYLPHAKAAAEQRPKDEGSLLEWATIMYKAGWYLRDMGLGQEALKMTEDALGVRTRLLGQEDEGALWAKGLVSDAKKLLGQWGEAEQLQAEVVEIRKARFGSDHPDTLTSMNNLALLFLCQGRYKEAEELQVEVMEANKTKRGLDHPETLTNISNLASTYRDQGRYKEAEELHMEVMEARKARLGLDHPGTLTSISNLALTYSNQGRYKEAEELQVEVMEANKVKRGLDHPETLTSISNLASTYIYQGRYKEAEELQVEVMEARKARLGLDHPDTLSSISSLASTYIYQGRYKEAEELQVEVMEARKAILELDHPDILTSMSSLASIYWVQGRYEMAEGLDFKVLETTKTKLGPGHPNTITYMANLATTYSDQGRDEEAEKLELEVLKLSRAMLGPDHPDSLSRMANLAVTYRQQGRYEEAEKLEVEVLEGRKAIFGADHPSTIRSMANLAATYENQGRNEEAEKLQVEVVEGRKAILGPDHPKTLKSMHILSCTWYDLGHGREAIALMRQCLELRTFRLGKKHPDTESSAQLLSEWEADAVERECGEADLGIADLSIQ